MKESISVVIPTRNEEKNLSKLLDSMRNVAKFKGEIIVIDTSSDKTPQIAKKQGCKVVRVDTKMPPVEKRQIGTEMAKGKIVVIIDADRRATKDFFKEILKVKNWDALLIKEIKTEDTFIEKVFNARCYTHEYSLSPCVFKKYIFKLEPYDFTLAAGDHEEHYARLLRRGMKVKKSNATIIIHTVHTLKKILRQMRWYGRTSYNKFKKDKELKDFSFSIFILLPLIFFPIPLIFKIPSIIVWLYEIFIMLRSRSVLAFFFPILDFLRGVAFFFGMIEFLYNKQVG